MRHVVIALALALGPLGPAVCEVACTHEMTSHAADMPTMPGSHMTSDDAPTGDGGMAVTSTGDCRHPETRPALRTAGAPAPDALGPAAAHGVDPTVPLSGHGRMIAGRVAHSPPARSAPRPLRI